MGIQLKRVKVKNEEISPKVLTAALFSRVEQMPKDKEEEIELLRRLAQYPEEIRLTAETLEPSRLTRYVLDVAAAFHSFYNACRVRGEEGEIMKARLILVESTKIVIKNVLELLSINAPEKM